MPSVWQENPTSSSQQGLIFTHQLITDYQPLNTGISIELKGPLNQLALRHSLDALITRHEQLRTTFHITPSDIISRTFKLYTQPIELFDLSELTPAEKTKRIAEIEHNEICHPFDLTQLPLLRVTVITLSKSEHILIVVNHHITGDGTSLFDIYLGELSQLYFAYCKGQDNPLPPLTSSFIDFIKTQEAENSEGILQKRLNFWTEQLRNAPTHIEIASDRQRPTPATGAGGRVEGKVYQGLTKQVSEFSDKAGISPIAVFMGAFYALLYRFSNQADMVIGLPLANRTAEFMGVYGPIFNTLPIRAQISDEMTFSDLLSQIQETSFRSILRGNLPFETIIANIKHETDRSRSPIHQVVFNYMNFSTQNLQMYDLDTNVRRLFPNAIWMDLIVEAEEKPDGFCLSINYNADIYEHNSIARLINSYQVILEAGLTDSNTPLAKLPLLSPEQLEELTIKPNNTWCNYPESLSIQGAFEAQVDLTPEAIAVRCGTLSLSYIELDNRANCLAQKLRTMGIERNQIVGLCMSRQVDMLTALLAILKSGAAYLPLDPIYPHERLRFMLEDSNAAIVITVTGFEDVVNSEGRQLLFLDNFDFISGKNTRPLPINKPSDLAYVIYTSGSTGKPKGVMVEHRNASNFFTAMDKVLCYNHAKQGIWVAVTSISFDISVLEIFWSISRGFTVILQSDELNSANSASSLIIKYKATHFQCTPSQARMILAEKNANQTLACLDKMMVGGEALSVEIAQDLRHKLQGQLFNLYGPTETTIWSASHIVRTEDTQTIPIGGPIANTALYILDNTLQPVPQGVIGELFIGGAGVVRGYLHRDALTAQRFMPNPFLQGNTRMYRTGDLVRYREDGTIQFVGRNDQQVKLRGHRIEMGEVEAHVQKLKGVNEVVCAVREDIQGDQKLIAYIVASNELDETQTRNKLSQSIPGYMIPNLFITIDKLPLTANGKIDRNALPKPQPNLHKTIHKTKADSFVNPRNDTEIRLSMLWQDLLGVNHIGVHDNFFDLGGHSILSLQLAGKIESEFKTSFEPVKVFMSPTIEEQAKTLVDSMPAANSTIVTLQKKGKEPPIFCLCGIHIYQDLAKLVGEEQPFLAMYVPEEIAFLTNSKNHGTIEELARAYYDIILTNHDGMPLRLLGFCFGGALAFEVASLAAADNIEVETLILLDTVLWCRLKRRNLLRAIKLFTKLPKIIFDKLYSRQKPLSQKPAKVFDDTTRFLALQNRMIDYKPKGQLNVNTILINSNDPDLFNTWKATPLLGWEDYLTGKTITINSSGEHTELLQKPMIEQVANQLRSLLNSTNSDIQD